MGYPLIHSDNLRVLFIFFVVLSNWVIFSVVTGVVSENMVSAAETVSKHDEEAEKATDLEESASILMTLFEIMDKKNDGRLEEAEFLALLTDEGALVQMKQATNLAEPELKHMFSLLSTFRAGVWSVDY